MYRTRARGTESLSGFWSVGVCLFSTRETPCLRELHTFGFEAVSLVTFFSSSSPKRLFCWSENSNAEESVSSTLYEMSRPVIRGFRGQRRIYAPEFRSYEDEEFGDLFEEPEGLSRREIQLVRDFPRLPDEYGIYQPTQAVPYYPRPPSPRPQAGVSNSIEAFYADRFRKLEMEARRARQSEPLLVGEGRVPTFGLLDTALDSGDAVFGTDLEVHLAPPVMQAAEDHLPKSPASQALGPDDIEAYYEAQFRRLEQELPR